MPELTRMRNVPLQQNSNRGFCLPESEFDFRPFLRRGGIIIFKVAAHLCFSGLENQAIGVWANPKVNKQKHSTAYSK